MRTLVSFILFFDFSLLEIWSPSNGWKYLFGFLAIISYIIFAVYLLIDLNKFFRKIKEMKLDCKRRCDFYILSIFLFFVFIGGIILGFKLFPYHFLASFLTFLGSVIIFAISVAIFKKACCELDDENIEGFQLILLLFLVILWGAYILKFLLGG